MIDELLVCTTDSWSPTIGDPSIMGWATVFSYVLAALLSSFVLLRGAANRRTFWYFITFALVLLAFNKQLDLQSAMTAIGRCIAKLQGWYEHRRAVQVTFILALLSVSILMTLILASNLRYGLKRIWLAFFGFAFLVTFVFVRAAGFHGFDQVIGFELGVLRMNWVLELTGILMISLNAIMLLSQGPASTLRKKRRKSSESDLSFRRSEL